MTEVVDIERELIGHPTTGFRTFGPICETADTLEWIRNSAKKYRAMRTKRHRARPRHRLQGVRRIKRKSPSLWQRLRIFSRAVFSLGDPCAGRVVNSEDDKFTRAIYQLFRRFLRKNSMTNQMA